MRWTTPSRPSRWWCRSPPPASPTSSPASCSIAIARPSGQTIVIDNRPGAGGTIAIEQVVNAPPDGYTLIMADPSGSLPANVTLYPNLKYHPMRDLAPIAIFGTTGAVLLVNNDSAGQNRAGAGRARQEQARRTDLRLDRHRHAGPSQRRTVQPARRHQGRARALSRGRTGRDRHHRRPHLVLDRADPDHAAERAAGAAAPARGRGRPALGRPARRADHQGNRHRRLRRLAPPMRCSRPAGTPKEIVDRLHAEIKRALDDETVQQKLRAAGVIAEDRHARGHHARCWSSASRNGPT